MSPASARVSLASALLLSLSSCATTTSAESPATPPPSPDVRPPDSEASAPATFELPTPDPDADPDFSPALKAHVPAGAPADTIEFGWKAPCEVPVRSFKYRSDQGSAITRMRLDFQARDDGYRLRLRDVAFETFNGQPIDSPELRAQLQQILAMTTASMPEFLISREGRYTGIVGLEEMVEALLEQLGPDVPESVVAAMKQPAMLRQLETSISEYWDTWVEAWDGRAIEPGETIVEQRRLGLLEGSMVVNLEVEHLGTLDDDPNLRLLRTRQVMEGDAAKEMMMAQVRRMAQDTGGPMPADDAIGSVRRVSTLYVAIDPKGARPYRTRLEKLIEVDDKRRLEVMEWEFDWARAKGCK